jgi:hypothetical protein
VREPGEEDELPEPWTDPDHPDDVLDAAYRSGIMPPDERDDGWDSITVLQARDRRLAKRIGLDGSIEDYDYAKHFDLVAIPVDGLDHLEDDLRRLLYQPDRCVVRGGIAGRAMGVRRLLHPDDDDPASLVDVPRRWLALDVDSLALLPGVEVEDIAACASAAIVELPAEFHGIRCIAQATASHGFKPGMRLRLWFWLDRPAGGAELKRWLASSPVDPALFGANQPIYTASPIFIGRSDPLQHRMVRLPGSPQVAVPELPEPERPAVAPLTPTEGLSPYAEAALDSACRNIADARVGERDKVINSEAYSIGRLAGGRAIPQDFALRALRYAVTRMVGYSSRDLNKVERAFNAGLSAPRGVPAHG